MVQILDGHQAQEIRTRIREARPVVLKTFNFHAKIHDVEEDTRIIEGYASTRDLDRSGDVVEPNAFEESLKEFMQNPVLTYMHNWHDPIGKVNHAAINSRGLYIKAQVSRTADKVWTLIREGVLRAFSIGYDVLEERMMNGVNHLVKLKLYEVAVVSIPANRHALFSIGKALKDGTDLVCMGCQGARGDPPRSEPGSVGSLTLLEDEFEAKKVAPAHRPPGASENTALATPHRTGWSLSDMSEIEHVLKEVRDDLEGKDFAREITELVQEALREKMRGLRA